MYVFMAALALADMFVIAASTVTALVCLFLQISTYVFMAALALADMFVIAASTVMALVCLFFTDIHVCVYGGPGFGRHVCYCSQYSDCGSFLLERISGQHRL